jgi:uncharacterized protein (TIGR02118 family)
MASRVFFLATLRAGKDPDEYDRFLREVDYPLTTSLLPVTSYRATRIEGRVLSGGTPTYQYIDVIDVEDIEEYRAALRNPTAQVQRLLEQVDAWIADATDLYGTQVA